MRGVGVILPAMALLVASAFAQGKLAKDLKPEIAKCANSSTGLKRLACYDELAKRIGIETPKAQHEPTEKQRKDAEIAYAEAKAAPPDDGKQAARKKFIDDAIKYEALQKVVMPGSVPHMWVSPIFYQLDFDIKRNLAGVVFDYYKVDGNPNISVVILKDSKSGKQVGTYSPALGLDMD